MNPILRSCHVLHWRHSESCNGFPWPNAPNLGDVWEKKGQGSDAMTSEAAAINDAIRHYSKWRQRPGGYRGLRWQVIDSAGIEVHSVPP